MHRRPVFDTLSFMCLTKSLLADLEYTRNSTPCINFMSRYFAMFMLLEKGAMAKWTCCCWWWNKYSHTGI